MSQDDDQRKRGSAHGRVCRKLFAVLSVMLAAGVVVWTCIIFWSVNLDTLPGMPWNDLIGASIDLHVSRSQSMFNLLLLASGAIAGLIIAKSGEPRLLLRDAPEVVMSICTAILLLVSFAAHVRFTGEIQSAYEDGGFAQYAPLRIPNVLETDVIQWLHIQRASLVCGGAVALLTLFSAHRLRGES